MGFYLVKTAAGTREASRRANVEERRGAGTLSASKTTAERKTARKSTERAVFDEFRNQAADSFFRRRNFDEALFLEDDRFDSVNFRRRTGQTATVEFGGNVVERPLFEAVFRSERRRVGDFRRNALVLVAHHFNRGLRTRFVRFFDDRNERRKGRRNRFPTVAERAAERRFAVFHVDNFGKIRNLRNPELFGGLRAGLRGVAVDRLATAEDEIVIADRFDRLREDVARGERVGPGGAAVGDQDRAVGAAVEAVAQNVGGFREPHRHDR